MRAPAAHGQAAHGYHEAVVLDVLEDDGEHRGFGLLLQALSAPGLHASYGHAPSLLDARALEGGLRPCRLLAARLGY